MAEIYGIFHYRKLKIDPVFLEGVITSLANGISDYSDTWKDNHVAFGCNFAYSTPQSLEERLPYFDKASGCSIVADARIDYREELAERLDIYWKMAKDLPDSLLILKAYEKWGEECVKYLYGDFAFAIWDSREKILTCARDQIGIRPFFYLHSEEYFAFSSSIRGLERLGIAKLNIEEKYLIDSLMLQQPVKIKSPFSGIIKLEPATIIEIDKQNHIKKQKYWDLKVNPTYSKLNEKQAIEGLQKRIKVSVHERLRSAYKIGCELSGGLDSSYVASIASSILNQKSISLNTLTQCLSEVQKQDYFPFVDESYYSNLITNILKVKNHHYITGEERGIIESVERTLLRLSGPFAPDYALLSDILFEKAQNEDVRVMLSGFGGDEGVSSSNNGYFKDLAKSKQCKLLYEQIRHRSNKTKLSSILSTIKILAISQLRSLIRVTNKFLFYSGIQSGRYKYIPLHRRLKKKYRTKKLFYKTKIERLDFSLRSKMYSRIQSNYVTNRLESTTINSNAYKIEYRYPLLDIKLLEYFYSLPSHLKYKNGINRYLYRMAAEGVLPEQIRWRNDKSGYTIPNVHYRIKIDVNRFRSLISESIERNNFHYIDYRKLNRIFTMMMNREKKSKIGYGNMIFLTSIGVLILQKWQREGKIDIGIKC